MEPPDRIEVTNWVDDFKHWLNEPIIFHKKWHFITYMIIIGLLNVAIEPGWVWRIF